jgi:hypothetical protein
MNRRTLTLAGAAMAASLAFTASASAQTPVTLSFNHVVLNTPATPDAQIVTPSSQPLTMAADVNPDGSFTVQPPDFHAPTYTTTSPVDASVTVSLADPATGSMDATTGALSMTADFLATLTVPNYGSCTVDTGDLTLTTATTQPLAGQRFPATPTGISSGAGAFGVGWSTLPPGTGSICSEIDSYVDGPGGIWISRNITIAQAQALSAPKLTLKSTKPAAVRAGRTAVVKVTLANTGAADTKSVRVCLSVKPPLSPRSDCKTVATPKAKSTATLSFAVKTTGATAGTHLLILTATGLKRQTVALRITG